VVRAGEDRHGQRLLTTPFPLDEKVGPADSDGGIYVFEHLRMGKGGPFRHFHHAQDEWFRVIEGQFAFEIGPESGPEKFRLSAGDSIFAPRRTPHVWASVGDTPGTMILLVQPAGSLDAFFRAQAKLKGRPTRQEAERLFAAHGMTVVGDPLPIA
jgi:mannose-6-phosphate isomerase-like protein (cupin superfamily)